jgi:hypothetical protein
MRECNRHPSDQHVATPVVAIIRAKVMRVRACVVVNGGVGEHDITATMRFGTSLAEPK